MNRMSAVLVGVALFAVSLVSSSEALPYRVTVCAQSLNPGNNILSGKVTVTNTDPKKSFRLRIDYNVHCNAGATTCDCGSPAGGTIVEVGPNGSLNFGCSLPCNACGVNNYCTDVQITNAKIIAYRNGLGPWEEAAGGQCSTSVSSACGAPSCCNLYLMLPD